MLSTPSAFGKASCIGTCTGTFVDADIPPKGTLMLPFERPEGAVELRPMARIGSRPSRIRKIVLFPDPTEPFKFLVEQKRADRKASRSETEKKCVRVVQPQFQV